MPIRSIIYIFFAILFVSFSLFGGVKKNSVQAKSDGSTITIWWETDDVSGIQSFKVLRSISPLSGYEVAGTVYPKEGATLYSFEDDQPFMKTTTLYYYRIETVGTSGSQSYEPSLDGSGVAVDHTTSGVRRTWGSIKAMFR
jgi:hypothetical protein